MVEKPHFLDIEGGGGETQVVGANLGALLRMRLKGGFAAALSVWADERANNFFGVMDVHLAAEGFEVESFVGIPGHFHSITFMSS